MTKPFAKPSFKQLLVIALIIVIGLTISWQLPLNNGPSQKDWDANRQNLPEIAALEERIQLNLFGEQAPATEGMGPDIDQPIDIEAMEAKLAGLTKNVTTLRQPTEQELTEFYQAHQADYRQASKFSFSQILFSRTKHGGQAYQKAEQALLAIAQGQMPSGDSSDLQRSYGLKSADKIDQEFGSNFSAKAAGAGARQPPEPALLDRSHSLNPWRAPGLHRQCGAGRYPRFRLSAISGYQ